jgi:hypothetical protein
MVDMGVIWLLYGCYLKIFGRPCCYMGEYGECYVGAVSDGCYMGSEN